MSSTDMGPRIAHLRRSSGRTQEELATELGVSRQAVSKWESGAAIPETDKLLQLADVFGCTLDHLLKGTAQSAPAAHDAPQEKCGRLVLEWRPGDRRTRTSERTVFGMPLWQVGRHARGFFAVGLEARGVVAVGLLARGVVSLGLLSLGIVSFGLLAVGVAAFGLLAIGLAAAGCFAAGLVAAGAVALGALSLGAVACGGFSAGALALGAYGALGDHAQAMVALGDSEAVGSVFSYLGDLTPAARATALEALDRVTPAWLGWAKDLFAAMLG